MEMNKKRNKKKKEHPLTPSFTVALSLKEQMLEEIPVTHHDWLVDALIVGDGGFFAHQR